MKPGFKTEMLIYQSKANLDGKFLFGKFNRHLDFGKCWETASLGTRIPNSILVHDLLAIETKILFLKRTM